MEESTSPTAIGFAADGISSDKAEQVVLLDPPKDFYKSPTKTIDRKDLAVLAGLPVLAAIAWICSDSLCLRLTQLFTRVLGRQRPQRYQDYDEILRDFHPEPPQSEPPDERSIEAAALQHLERLQLLRYHRPGRWGPKIEVAGKDHLDRALAQGKGAILWVASSVFSDIISKAAIREQGIKLWHLSRPSHGHFSTTRFGIRYLNPIRIAVECRFLAARVVIDSAAPRAAPERLKQLLGQNEVVSITVDFTASRVALVPYGAGRIALAGGAANLAMKSGTALLPVFTERRPDGSFLVTIEAPLEAPPGLDRGQQVAHLLVQEAALLFRYFKRLPSQFFLPRLHYGRRLCEPYLPKDA